MAFKCSNCGHKVDEKPKKGCPGCGKICRFDVVADAPKNPGKEEKPPSEWEAAASTALTAIIRQPTLDACANSNGLPDEVCLTAMYSAVAMPEVELSRLERKNKPEKREKKIAFSVFGANYDSKSNALTGFEWGFEDRSFDQTGHGASVCAEYTMWENLSASVRKKPYIGIGQTVCPCRLCMARYAALARKLGTTILVLWENGYDGEPDHSWAVFSSAGTAYVRNKKE